MECQCGAPTAEATVMVRQQLTNRREFLETSAAILAATAWPSPPVAVPDTRLRIGFSTLGCPQWEWPRILDFAKEHGYAAVELRGLLDMMDLTKRPEFAPDHIAETNGQIAGHGLQVSCLGSSANMHDLDPDKRAVQLDEARRFIDLAQALGAPYVRVFG